MTAIYGCFVNESKEIVTEYRQSTGMMSENEAERYFGLMKRALSGTLGKNLVDITFRTAQVASSPEHKFLMDLRSCALKDDELRTQLYRKIIENVHMEESFLILLGCDSYDVPFKSKDGDSQPDASAEVYTRTMGECMCLTFSASYMNKAYTMEKEDLTSPMLALLGELMFNPLTVDGGFLPQYVESEKKNQIDIIRSRKDNKSTYAVRRCVELMCENEAYAIPADGNEETVSRINGKNLYEFHKRIISQCPVHIVFSGNADGEDIYNKLCENISFTPRVSSIPQNVIIQKADKIKLFTEEMNISQSKLSIGCRTGIEEGRDQWLAFSVFKEIFAISPTSKLFMNVREKLSLCYYCSMVSQYIKGMFVISAGINACDKDKAYNAIMNELTAMKNGDFTDEEFDTAIRNIKSSFRGVTDSIRSINNF
jgi:hypothetical protein